MIGRARPTTYRGIRMRSRLEAAWAEQFDAWGVGWHYEPECFASPEGQYLPDFQLDCLVFDSTDPVERTLSTHYFEVKPGNFWQYPEDEDDYDYSANERSVLEAQRWARILESSKPDVALTIATVEQDLACFETFFRGDRGVTSTDPAPCRCDSCGALSFIASARTGYPCPHCRQRVNVNVPWVSSLYVSMSRQAGYEREEREGDG